MSGWSLFDDAEKGVDGESGRAEASVDARPSTPAAADADYRAQASMGGDGGREGGGMACIRPRWGAPFVAAATWPQRGRAGRAVGRAVT